jgi:hypothetical protein
MPLGGSNSWLRTLPDSSLPGICARAPSTG